MRLLTSALALLLGLAAPLLAAGRTVTVFIRVDDVFMLESDKKPMEIDAFLRVAERHGAKVMLAAIPNRLLQRTNAGGVMTSEVLAASSRGHQVVQHGFDHRCAFTGATGREFSTTAALTRMTQDERIAKILQGRTLLQAVTGKPVTSFVFPGDDGSVLLERDTERLRAAGFTWVRGLKHEFTEIRDGQGTFPWMDDYTWGLTEENYAAALKKAQYNFRAMTVNGDEWGMLFHDHFTRQAYNNGIVLKWLEEMLTWIDAQPEVSIRYMTLDDLMAAQAAR